MIRVVDGLEVLPRTRIGPGLEPVRYGAVEAARLGVAPGDVGSVRLRRDVAKITAAMTAKRVTASAADGNSGVVWVEVEVEANTTTLPVIHAWRVQWYS